MNRRYQGAAVVTGASSGIGASFARRLSAEGYPLVLVARRGHRLAALAGELPTDVRIVVADLATPGGCAAVEAGADGLEVGMLVHAAGFGCFGRFEELDRERQLAMIDLHCRAPVDLAHRFAPGMVARSNGAIVIVSSISAFQASPWLATYGATKAHQLSLAEALHVELKDRGVDVLGVCPGPTRTEWKDTAGVDVDPAEAMWLQADQVVDAALSALGRRSGVVVGAQNKLTALLTRLAPRGFSAWAAGQVMWRMSRKLRGLPGA